jgi:hypothetical protein
MSVEQIAPSTGRQPPDEPDSRLAARIRAHMAVVDQSGAHVGTVDHVEGGRIKLTRDSSASGEHEFLPLSQVAAIEGDCVRLQRRGGTTFGMEADRYAAPPDAV